MMRQNQDSLDQTISNYKSLTYAIAETLQKNGYYIANSRGIKVYCPDHDSLGILEPRAPIPKSILGFKWDKEQRALYIGRLWVENEDLGASHNTEWVLEVYGKDNIPKLTKLVNEISESSHVKVQIRLCSKNPGQEMKWEDFMSYG